ncbi:hypothetical protein G6F40_015881 [Rhizopus arrhizus]|nr:hypothetical protein G6F40_015881 [Rhizopus arrhizus]
MIRATVLASAALFSSTPAHALQASDYQRAERVHDSHLRGPAPGRAGRSGNGPSPDPVRAHRAGHGGGPLRCQRATPAPGQRADGRRWPAPAFQR